jgi:hypothetical protein
MPIARRGRELMGSDSDAPVDLYVARVLRGARSEARLSDSFSRRACSRAPRSEAGLGAGAGGLLSHVEKKEIKADVEDALPINSSEHDVYIVTGSERINLKIRRRDNAFKLKRLYERTDDGFERWRTEFDASLPVGVQLSLGVLDLIGNAGPRNSLVLLGVLARPCRS